MSKVINFAEAQSDVDRQETAHRFAELEKQKTNQANIDNSLAVGSENSVSQHPREKWILIKSEFQDLIPPLSEDEFKGLEESISKEGCREPLVLWNNYLIDGHHRYEICLRHDLPFKTMNLEFSSERQVMIWILKNQFNRRNLDVIVKIQLNTKLDELQREEARERSFQNLQQFKPKESTEWQNFATRRNLTQKEKDEARVDAKIGQTIGISREQYRRGKKVLEKASPEEIKDIKAGNDSINKVYTKIRKKERQEVLEASHLPEGKYRVLYVAPNWKHGSEPVSSSDPDAAGYFPAVTAADLCDIPIDEICESDAALFLWAIPELLPEAFKVMSTWGFKYRSIFTWAKGESAKGKTMYNNMNQEFLLVGEKGNCHPESETIASAFQHIPKNPKSAAKPDEFRKIIETLYYATENKVELYARKECAGWSRYQY